MPHSWQRHCHALCAWVRLDCQLYRDDRVMCISTIAGFVGAQFDGLETGVGLRVGRG